MSYCQRCADLEREIEALRGGAEPTDGERRTDGVDFYGPDGPQCAEPFECDQPPHGWRCTRRVGHTGPCAAVRVPPTPPLIVEPRHREASSYSPQIPDGHVLENGIVRAPDAQEEQ